MSNLSKITILLCLAVLVFAPFPVNAGWTSGKFGTAIDFNGTSTYIDGFGAIGNIKTVSFWIKADSLTEEVMDLNGAQTITISAGTISANGFTSPTIYVDGKVSSTLPDTNWHHIAITTDTDVDASAVVIGKVGTDYFAGTLDNVQLYAYARTADEIRLDYNAGLAAHLGPSGKTCSEDPASCMDYGLVGYWNFDEGTGQIAYDNSDNNNDGTLGGTSSIETSDPVWTTPTSSPSQGGVKGSALSFDGVDDYVDCGNTSEGTIELTISAWIYRKSEDTFDGIVCHTNGTSATDGWWFSATTIANERILISFDDTDFRPSSCTIPINTWVYVALTYNSVSNELKWYKNGAFLETDDTTGHSITESSAHLKIGVEDSFYGFNSFDGAIDEVRIYNRVLSAEEIRYHYNRGGPVAHWKFDEGSGQTAHDSAGDADAQLGSDALPGGDVNDPSWSRP